VKVVIEESTSRNLVPNGDSAWNLQLSRTKEGPPPGTAHLRVDYNQKAQTGSSVTPRVVLSSLEVKSPQIETLDQIADVQVQSSLEALTEQTPGRIYLVITNKTNVPLNASITPRMPEFLVVDRRQDLPLTTGLEPHQAGVIEVPILAERRVRPGKHMLVFDVEFTWGKGDQRFHRHVILNREVTVGVLGESTLLTLIGAPTLLFLPGFLIVRTYKFLWTQGFLKSKYDTGEFFLKETADQVLVEVTISLVVLVISAGFRWDYIGLYGLSDLVNLYLLSVGGLGAIAYVIWMWARGLWLSWSFPDTKDSPLTVLEKLAWQGQEVYLDRFDLGTGQSHQDVFVLEPIGSARATWWVGPAIRVGFKPTGSSLTPTDLNKLDRDINALLEPGRTMKDLCNVLKRNSRKRIPLIRRSDREALDIRWKPSGLIDGPMEKSRSDLKAPRPTAPIIDFRTPSSEDDPVTILRKLARQGLGVYLDRFDLGTSESPKYVFSLEPWDLRRETLWVGPRIQVTLNRPALNLDQKTVDQIRKQIEVQLTVEGRADLLADVLETALGKKAVQLKWKASGNIRSEPEELKTSDLPTSEDKKQKEWICEFTE